MTRPEQSDCTAGFQVIKSDLAKVPNSSTIKSQSSPSVAWYHAVQDETMPVCTGEGRTVVVDGMGLAVPFQMQ